MPLTEVRLEHVRILECLLADIEKVIYGQVLYQPSFPLDKSQAGRMSPSAVKTLCKCYRGCTDIPWFVLQAWNVRSRADQCRECVTAGPFSTRQVRKLLMAGQVSLALETPTASRSTKYIWLLERPS
jgi:hypothetical protein